VDIERNTDVRNCLFTMTHCNAPIDDCHEEGEEVVLVGKYAEITTRGVGHNNYAIFDRAKIVRETEIHIVVIYMANPTLVPGKSKSTTESIKKSDIVKLRLYVD